MGEIPLSLLTSTGGEGAEVVYALRNDSTLAKAVLEGIGSAGQIMRKYYQRRLPENPNQDYYFIQRLTGKTEPILVEYGFIDNASDSQKLKTKLDDLVEGAVKAITEYAGYKYTPPANQSNRYYTVQKGDSLWSIANRFNTTVADLKRLNNLTSDTLTIGQQLLINQSPNNDTDTDETTIYIVQKGDSLWSIANKFNTSVDKLKQLNNLTSNVLSIGQEIIIVESENIPTKTYTVQKGDSLWSIANKFNTTINDLRRLNNLTSDTLTIGQQLQIPTSEEIPSTITYTVQKGDSLWNIANKYNTTVNEIISLNNLTSNTLQIGQQLLIPTTIQNPDTSETTYIVKKGDSLWTIANKYNITVDELKRANNLNSNILTIGQELIIPNTDRTSESESDSTESTYQVKKGDSLWLIAKKYNTTVTELIDYNQLETINLKINDTLKIPNIRNNHYIVQKGDTLWNIASSHNLSVQELKQLNDLKDNSVTIGQILIIS